MSSTENFPAPPTMWRWGVVAVATAMSALLYLDRFCVSFAEVYIQEDLGLTTQQMSWFISAFFWSYALAQVPSGWFSERYGSRLMMVIYIVSWSVFTGLIGCAYSLAFLILMRLGCGLGQSGAYPTSAGLLRQWMPITARGTASSFVTLGGRLGAWMSPMLTAWLIVMFIPRTSSSQLEPHQVFPEHMGRLCARLSDPQSELGVYLSERLRPEVRTLVAELGAKYRSANPPGAEKVTPLSGTAEQVEQLRAGLNALIQNPEWYDPKVFRNLNLAKEAQGLAKQREKGPSLTEFENERLNRLVLEAALPEGLGKIYVRGWRPVVLVYGFSGLLVALTFWIVVRNTPREHPWCNQAEKELVPLKAPELKADGTKASSLPWGEILTSPGMLLSSFSQFGINVGWLFAVTTLPRYLDQVHHVEIIQRGFLCSLPMVFGMLGMLCGGPLTDYLRHRIGLRWGRSLPMGLTKFVVVGVYVGCMYATDPITTTALICVGSFFTDLGIPAIWAYTQDAGGRATNVVLGFGNMWGNLGAAVAPLIYGWLLTDRPETVHWNSVFVMCAGCYLVSGFAGLLIDATKPIVRETHAV